MLTDPLFYLAAIPAVLIVGISKGGFGGSLGMIAVPMLTLTVASPVAAAIMLPILFAMDIQALWRFRQHFDKRNLKILLPAATLGISIGALTFQHLSENHLKLIIGITSLLFCGNAVLQELRNRTPAPREPHIGRGAFWGTLAGFTSFSIHAGGPPLNFYLLPQRLNKTVFVTTSIIFFACVNGIKLIPYSMLGLFSSQNLLTSLVLMPLAIAGVRLGARLHHVLDATLFYRLCYCFLFLVGLKLTAEALL
ncbi:sulfite exporter TauE/SafE family protein [Aliamphritea spongicola]|uniref:sulfite exporter TauE/SafE family protein n=1 Tax=Aliamphritea spongicola TaxID=707589 RepID=UPI00196B9749|nr:sulfite exporter TauE/SafE family protein [Aliamphritea spongicola]MBN3562759.1 sulfite exporter TauE/SafE family protein [Aliamphritea spongicola]